MSEAYKSDTALQYALMLRLPPEVIGRIKEIGKEFEGQFSFPGAVTVHPHITLAYWHMDPQYEKRLSDRLEIQSASIQPSVVRLNGFEQLSGGAFCLKVENAETIAESLFHNKGFFRRKMKMEVRAAGITFTDHLHVTVARKLTLDQLKIVFEKWKARRFQHEFPAESMTLLKYLADRKAVAGEFSFSGSSHNGQPGKAGIQASLF